MVVSGVLADGIPWDMPYRCPGLVWNPYRRTYTILIRIITTGGMAEIPLSLFYGTLPVSGRTYLSATLKTVMPFYAKLPPTRIYSNTGREISIFIRAIFPRADGQRRWRENGGIISQRKRKLNRITATAIICN